MRRLRIEIVSDNGQILAASCVESIAPLRGMWQVWRHGAIPVADLQAAVSLTVAAINYHRQPKEVPTDRIRRRAKARHGHR